MTAAKVLVQWHIEKLYKKFLCGYEEFVVIILLKPRLVALYYI